MSYLLYALTQLIEIGFNVVVMLFLARLAAEASRADFRNPLSQLIYRITNPVLAPIRHVLANWRTINLAALLVIWLLLLIEQLLLWSLAGHLPHLGGLLIIALAKLIDFVLLFYLVLIVAWSLLSLLSNHWHHPLNTLISTIVQPLMRPLRGKLVFGMVDFTPTAVIIALMLGRWIMAAPLLNLGEQLAGIP